MRPKSTTHDLPSSYDVKTHIHNEFVRYMKKLKEEICVSNFTTLDLERLYLQELLDISREGLNNH
jgi:hypothetical protein